MKTPAQQAQNDAKTVLSGTFAPLERFNVLF